MKKILMLTPNSIPNSIIQSQVFGKALYFKRKKDVTIAIDERNKNFENNEIFNFLLFNSYKELKQILIEYDEIYIRSINDFFRLILFCRLKNIQIIYDFRGLVAFESYFRKKNILRFLILFAGEFLAYRLSENVQCVSNNLKIKLFKYYGRKKVDVIPCLTFDCIKRKDDINNRIKFVYLGGLSKWQRIDLIISTSIAIQKIIKAEFTFITYEKKKLKEKLKKTPLLKYKIVSVDNRNVINYLKNQDFGFLFRHDIIVNEVASPIKFLEYISSGVIPILTPFVGDYSKEVVQKKLGIIFRNDNEKLIKDIKKVSDQIILYRKRLYDYSLSYTWKNFNK
jgi:hypothetical protein